jgi:hypothetical protein
LKAISVEEGAGAASVKAEETERAMVGDMREAATQDAVMKVWRAHRAHNGQPLTEKRVLQFESTKVSRPRVELGANTRSRLRSTQRVRRVIGVIEAIDVTAPSVLWYP